MSTRRGRRPRTATAVATATAAVLVTGCGGPTPIVEEPVPVALAEPVPFEVTHLEEPVAASPEPDPPPEPSPADDHASTDEPAGSDAPPEPAQRGPSSADAAAFLASEAVAGLGGLEHVVVDLDGDGWAEVVATGVRDGVGTIRVAWWRAGGYEVLASDQAGRGRDVIDLRSADLTGDDQVELLVVVEGDGRQSLAVWTVEGPGQLVRLEAEGGCNDGSHVYGVTIARLQSSGDGLPHIVADCDESPLPVADWSEHRWVWEDGAYRHVEPDPPPPEGDPPGQGNGNGNGNGDGNGGDEDGGGRDGDDDGEGGRGGGDD